MGTCNSRSKSTVTSKAYNDMQSGWKKRGKVKWLKE